MKPYPFDTEQQKWIKEHYREVKAKDVADKYGVKVYTVYNHIMKFNLGKKEKRQVEIINDGYFKIEERTIWI